MEPENLKFGGGAAASTMHPAVLVALIIASLLIFVLPRKSVILPLLYMTFLAPISQQFNIGGVHFLALRILILVALIRGAFSILFSKTRAFAGGFSLFDMVFLLWTFFHVVTFLFLFSFLSGAVVNQLGFVWDVLGGYLVLRFFIQDEEDINRVIRSFAYIAGILSLCMLNEHLQMVNVFGYFGVIRLVPETRDGLVRAQATFSHPLLAGAFGASLIPLFFLYWNKGKSKIVAIIGIVSATLITILAASSTPVLAYAAGIGALCFWPVRRQMRLFRWGLVIVLVMMHLLMKAPVWFVIAHISLFGGSSSDHRAYLIDVFIRHFNDWWLMGTSSAGTWGWDMWDTSNQYVSEGESGGLAAFLCFIALISICFSRLGKARKAVEGDRSKEWYFWCLGAALFTHLVGFFGISYFDHTRMAWFALQAIIVASTAPVLAKSKAVELEPASDPLGLTPLPPNPWRSQPIQKSFAGRPVSEFKPRRS